VGTYQGVSTNQATGILTNVLGLPSAISGNSNSANIAWNWSIQLGSGTQAFSPALSGLALPIVNGTGTGQLLYSNISVSYAGSSIFVSLMVTNYTSSAVTVTEIGLQGTVIIQYSAGGQSIYNFLLSYDTFSTAISIPPNSFAVFQITLSFMG
jgi:hypothetical protein